MNYQFSEEVFKNTFNWKSIEERSVDSCRITHHQNIRFKLFPYTANGKTPIVTDMEELIGDFIKTALDMASPKTDFDELMKKVKLETGVSEENEAELANVIHSLFYHDDKFVADNIGLYAYKGTTDNVSVEKMARYLNDVLAIGDDEIASIKQAMNEYSYNALEKLVTQSLGVTQSSQETMQEAYYRIFEDAGHMFKKDFNFMLRNGLSEPEDLADLLSLYYLFYTSQACIELDKFGTGSRHKQAKLYFALDWEKVSSNRECCKGGWKELSENISHIFSHAVTLELLNQTTFPELVVDYQKLATLVNEHELDDYGVASEIRKIEKIYTDAVGDYKDFSSIPYVDDVSETEKAMRHLYKCVEAQFINRKAANDKYVNKLLEFYRYRWLKNRKKSGLVFNLTERDIIFLTKISIQEGERIRLVDLFKEYENRGIYLDNVSKGLLQDFFSRLNLLDKKSDSGDAQYVKRIL